MECDFLVRLVLVQTGRPEQVKLLMRPPHSYHTYMLPLALCSVTLAAARLERLSSHTATTATSHYTSAAAPTSTRPNSTVRESPCFGAPDPRTPRSAKRNQKQSTLWALCISCDTACIDGSRQLMGSPMAVPWSLWDPSAPESSRCLLHPAPWPSQSASPPSAAAAGRT